jgi:alanine racemase
MSTELSFIELSRQNLLNNLAAFRSQLGHKKIVAVVKANAYGHGLREIVSMLGDQVEYFQVDDIEELRILRTVSDKPCLVLGYVSFAELEELVRLNGTLGVFEYQQLQKLNAIGMRQGKVVEVHVEIDAFLGRLGVLTTEAQSFIDKAKELPNIAIAAVYAHFSDIEDTENLDHAHLQYQSLLAIAQQNNMLYHISATSGILTNVSDEQWGGAMVRLGIGLYGHWPSEYLQKKWQSIMPLRPVLTWKTHIAQVKQLPANYPIGYGRSFITSKPTTIAIIPQGYSDGYDRHLSNTGSVLVRGLRCPVVGRIAMNMFAVDVSAVSGVQQEDIVTLIGQDGDETISAEQLAKDATIQYEIIARISPLLQRIVR